VITVRKLIATTDSRYSYTLHDTTITDYADAIQRRLSTFSTDCMKELYTTSQVLFGFCKVKCLSRLFFCEVK